MKKLLYFGYFIKSTNYPQLINSLKEVKSSRKLSYRKVLYEMIISAFKYKASFRDYFMFGFYDKSDKEKNGYLTTGRAYEFHKKMNNKEALNNFRDKVKFNNIFKTFIKRDYLCIEDYTIPEFCEWVQKKDYIVAKSRHGVAGKGIEKIKVNEYTDLSELYSYLKHNGLDLVEDLIQQHTQINQMNPLSVNTIRVITVRWQEKTDIIAAVLRIGVSGFVDNFSAGGIAAPIDIKTGTVNGCAVSKVSKVVYENHPKTFCAINGFEIPYWSEVINMVDRASEIIPNVKTVGWDIAITESGPELIEGNDNWNKDSFQLPYREGRLYLVDKYK